MTVTAKQLAMDLLQADSEEEVIALLTKAGYWSDRGAWRLYGDKEGNYAQVGNQQSRPEAALVEKLVNSVDARLMGECKARGVNPESDAAPASVRDAVARYYEGSSSKGDEAGAISTWGNTKRTEHARHITLAATGAWPGQRAGRSMCLTIVDTGEGQSPNRLPGTILSLNARNKQRVKFVQGKFNMGGSGALPFCGTQGLQLIISRRDRRIAERERATDDSVDEWGVTVVRREAPTNKGGEPIHSEYTYLAPEGAKNNPRHGEVLRFRAKSLPLMPNGTNAYAREIESGTAIKLYEYRLNVGRSNILMKGGAGTPGLLFALERLLPEIALPVRLHECRAGYHGHGGSFETTLAGLVVRLEEGRGDNLEEGFPRTHSMRVAGVDMTARIYAFKENGATTYLQDEGIIFTVNGQAQGHFSKSIFTRPKAVGLPKLKDSVLVLIDCSGLNIMDKEDLFMTSRDRLRNKKIRSDIEEAVQAMLKNNQALIDLQNRKREEEVKKALSDNQPLEHVLGKLFKTSPTLRSLFLKGVRLSNPFNKGGKPGGGNGKGSDDGDKKFQGKRHPTYFRIAGNDPKKVYQRNVEQGRRARVVFETDVENGYFERATDRGHFELEVIEPADEGTEVTHDIGLDDGAAGLFVLLPENSKVDDEVLLQATVTDSTLSEPLVNLIRLKVMKRQERAGGGEKTPKDKPGGGEKDGNTEGGIDLPEIIPVHQGDKNWVSQKFTENDACNVMRFREQQDGKEVLRPVFYINHDNISVLTEAKYSKQDPKLLRAKFTYANVLVGLAMLHEAKGKEHLNGYGDGSTRAQRDDDHREDDEKAEEPTVEQRIREFSRAVSPVMLPMIDQLSALNEDELNEISGLGED